MPVSMDVFFWWFCAVEYSEMLVAQAIECRSAALCSENRVMHVPFFFRITQRQTEDLRLNFEQIMGSGQKIEQVMTSLPSGKLT